MAEKTKTNRERCTEIEARVNAVPDGKWELSLEPGGMHISATDRGRAIADIRYSGTKMTWAEVPHDRGAIGEFLTASQQDVRYLLARIGLLEMALGDSAEFVECEEGKCSHDDCGCLVMAQQIRSALED